MGKYRELAAAIRKGAKMRPQRRGHLFRNGSSCALGAAYEGLGYKPVEGDRDTPGYSEQYDVLYYTFGLELCSSVTLKNDKGQTREQIADWLDSLEPRISDEQYTADFIKKMENAPQLETQHG